MLKSFRLVVVHVHQQLSSPVLYVRSGAYEYRPTVNVFFLQGPPHRLGVVGRDHLAAHSFGHGLADRFGARPAQADTAAEPVTG